MKLRQALLLVLLLSNSFYVKAMDKINLITEDWPPYNYFEGQKLVGYSTDIVRLVLKELGISEKIEVFPSMRAAQILESEKRTMFFSYIRTPKRENKFKWIGPFGMQSIYFYKRKNSPLEINNMEDAKKVHSVCSRSGGLVFDTLNELGFKNLDTSTNAKNIYLKAIIGRCDLAISETHLGYVYWMKDLKQPIDALVETPVYVSSSPLYIVATKDIPDSEIILWQKALDKVMASKAYIDISKKYGQ